MGFWPFGGGKKNRAQAKEDDAKGEKLEKSSSRPTSLVPEKSQTQTPSPLAARSDGKQGRNGQSARLTKSRSQLYEQENTTPTGDQRYASPPPQSPARAVSQRNIPNLYMQNPTSQSSIGPDAFSVVPQPPTLRAKRNDYDPTLPRRKSSKRKAEDHAREQEVRALASSPIPVPKRPITYSGTGPIRRESRNIPGDLNRRLNRPTSEISLPYPGSFSDMDETATQSSFKIGMFAALSPRPTLKYDLNPRTNAGKQPARSALAVQKAIEEEGSSQNRIDELADDLDAKGLRELMDRDHRRRERKREADRAKLQRKLQKRADRQREEEQRQILAAGGVGSSSPVSPSRDRNPIEGPSRQSFQDSREYSSTAYNSLPQRSADGSYVDPMSSNRAPIQPIRNPFQDEKDVDLMTDPFEHEDDDGERPPLPVKSPLRTVEAHTSATDLRPSSATISPPSSPAQRPVDRPDFFQSSIQPRESTPEMLESRYLDRRASDTSSQYASAWANFFRRAGRRKASTSDRGGRTTPSEFSNTSRESFARKQPPAPTTAARTFRYSASATPQRTLSKFREDLPELPVSPPYSRVQSPEAIIAQRITAVSPTNTQSARASLTETFESRSLMTSPSIPTLDKGRSDGRQQGRTSTEADKDHPGPTGIILSQSLASVDSEGSWLSGKPMKRISAPMAHALRQSRSSLQPQIPGTSRPDIKEHTGDETVTRFTPATPTLQSQSQSVPSTGGTEPNKTQAVTRKGSDGTESNSNDSDHDSAGDIEDKDDDDDDDTQIQDANRGGEEVQEASIYRAKSVDYKGHARHISAGSARLLDIRRSSTMLDSAPPTPTVTRSMYPASTSSTVGSG